MADVVVALPRSLRGAFKEPLGPIFADAEALLSAADGPLVAVGDAVTYHLRKAGAAPDVAVVDGLTEREAVDDHVTATVTDAPARIDVENPAGTLSRELLAALRQAVEDGTETVVVVDGEEDLATLPAVLVAPVGASVVYGQPGEGMVLVAVTEDEKRRMDALLGEMDGDPDRVRDLLGVDPYRSNR